MSKKHSNKRTQSVDIEDVQLWAWIRPTLYYSLIVFVFLLPWLSIGNIPDIHTRLFFWLVNFSFFFSLVAVVGIFTRILRVPRGRYLAVIGAFIVAKLISTLFSISVFRSIWGGFEVWSDGLLYLTAIAALGYGVLCMELTQKEIRNVLNVVLVQAFIVSALTIKEGFDLGLPQLMVRPDSPLQNSDYFLSYGLLILPLAFLLLVRTYKKSSWQKRIALTVNLAILGSAMFISLPFGIQGAVLPLPISKEQPVRTKTSAQDFLTNPSNAERWAEWDAGTRIGLKRPILGGGPGTTQLAFFDLQREGYRFPGDERGMTVQHPHNDLIEQFSQSGTVGLAAYLGIWVGMVVLYNKKRKGLKDETRLYASALFWGLMLFLLFNVFLFTTVVTGIFAALWIAILISILGLVASKEYDEVRPWHTISLCAVLAAFGVGTAYSWMYVTAHQNSNLANLAYTKQHPRFAITYSLNAVESFGYEPLYNWQAGLYSLIAIAQQSQEIQKSEYEPISQQAIIFSQEATRRDPYTTRYKLNQGLAEYFLSQKGSDQERKGIELVHRAEADSPMVYQMYQQAANFFIMKNDYDIADRQLQTALKLAPRDDKKKVEKSIQEFETYKTLPKQMRLDQ